MVFSAGLPGVRKEGVGLGGLGRLGVGCCLGNMSIAGRCCLFVFFF